MTTDQLKEYGFMDVKIESGNISFKFNDGIFEISEYKLSCFTVYEFFCDIAKINYNNGFINGQFAKIDEIKKVLCIK